MAYSDGNLLEHLHTPALIVVKGQVKFANAAAKALLGAHIVGQDVRISIRNPDAVAVAWNGLGGSRQAFLLAARDAGLGTLACELAPFPGRITIDPRGVNAVRVLTGRKDFTLDRLIAAAYDPYLAAFEQLLPPLFRAYDEVPPSHALKAPLAGPIATLRAWDRRTSTASVATSIAHFWGQDLLDRSTDAARAKDMTVYDYIAAETPAQEKLEALERVVMKLARDFGTWETPWGEINRFQRLSGNVKGEFDDSKPSLPIGFASGTWGSLAAFGATQQGTTKRIYGTRGNSFVAVVEFGPRLKAKSLLAGGVSGDPASPHFNDQAERYARGEFKEVLFYPEDIARQAKRTYRPGE